MRHLPTASLQLVRNALQNFPRPDRLAEQKLASWLGQRGIDTSPLELDIITFHYQTEVAGEGRAYVVENAVITQKVNLVEALLANWQGESAEGYGGFHYGDWAGLAPTGALTLVDRLEPLSVFSNAAPYQVFNGLYRRTQPPRYAPDTRLPIRAEDFQTYIWSLHFHNSFKASLDEYWHKRQAHYQSAIRIAFVAACNQQMLQGSLSEAGRLLVWQAAGLLAPGAIRLSMLNIYGYSSTSIVLIEQGSGPRVLLYLPGNGAPFHEFENRARMHQWFAQQCQDPEKRQLLRGHFARADWPDGLDFSGLQTALEGLGLYPRRHHLGVAHPGFATSGLWDPQQIIGYRADEYSPAISGDLFEFLTLRQKQRSYADADSQITSNHDIDKARWSSYLNLASVILMPLAIVVPELAPLLAAAGLAQFSLGLDQAINGKSLDDRAQGVTEQTFGLLNAVPLAGTAIARPAALFRYARPGFFTPERLRELLGTSFGTAPAPPALEQVELAFREPAVISSNSTAALVARVEDSLQHRFAAWLRDGDNLSNEWVEYEFASDSFVRSRDVNLISPPRWKVASEDASALTRSSTHQLASDEQRMATLRALGIDLDLPLDYDLFDQLQPTPIPKIVTSVWLGDQPLAGEFLDALRHNAQVLHGSDYRYQILLSRQHRSTYLLNLHVLRTQAKGALLMPLEDQGFFQDFQRSPYFAQYTAALTGPARNFASACDILRYRLLEHFGGLYLDADDRLLVASGSAPIPPLAALELRATENGLLLSPPVSNDQMGLYIKYNSSMIASHPGNPTLNAISDEILRRYERAPNFYQSRPDPLTQPMAFQAYARELNLLTGPAVLNAVIDQRLPLLRQLREACNLLTSPIYDLHATLNLSLFGQVMREHVPLDRVAQMGNAHSWAKATAHTR